MTTSELTGVVYDLGYVPHDGARLGRTAAIRAMVIDGVRRVMGIRRKARRKVFPWLMFGIAVIPAVVFVGLAFFLQDFSPDAREVFGSHANYYDLAGVPTFVFVALAAPELLIPDRVQGVLAVYSSRPISSRDYVLARLGTLGVLVIGFTLIPQLLMYVGFAAIDPDGFLSAVVGNWPELWKMAAASAALFAGWGAIGFLVSVFANRMTAARALFLGGLVASGGLAEALAQSGAFDLARYGALGAFIDHPFHIRDWIFGIRSATVPAISDFGPWVSLVVILALSWLSQPRCQSDDIGGSCDARSRVRRRSCGRRRRRVEVVWTEGRRLQRGRVGVGPGVTGLLGPNGAGKTTLLRMLSGLISPSKGSVAIEGRAPRTDHSVHRDVALVPEESGVYGFMTGREYVRYAATLTRNTRAGGRGGTSHRPGRHAGGSRSPRQRVFEGHATTHQGGSCARSRPTRAHPRRAAQRHRPGTAGPPDPPVSPARSPTGGHSSSHRMCSRRSSG